jgi:hypothetical protein
VEEAEVEAARVFSPEAAAEIEKQEDRRVCSWHCAFASF